MKKNKRILVLDIPSIINGAGSILDFAGLTSRNDDLDLYIEQHDLIDSLRIQSDWQNVGTFIKGGMNEFGKTI